jgi:uncharacterized protein YukE
MSEQQADTTTLQQLVDQMQSLTEYCDALKQGASTFAYMLPNDWQGPAMAAFLGSFEQWAAGAEALTQSAEALHQQATTAHTAYESAIEQLDTQWNDFRGQLP